MDEKKLLSVGMRNFTQEKTDFELLLASGINIRQIFVCAYLKKYPETSLENTEIIDMLTVIHEPLLFSWINQEIEASLETSSIGELRYSHYLAHPTWKAKRDLVLLRAGGRCSLCSSDYRVQVHHNTYTTRPLELPWNLVCLCQECHSLVHSSIKSRSVPPPLYLEMSKK